MPVLTSSNRQSFKETTAPQIATRPFVSDPELLPEYGKDWAKLVRNDIRINPTVALVRDVTIAAILTSEWSVMAEESAPEGADDFIQKELMRWQCHLVEQM